MVIGDDAIHDGIEGGLEGKADLSALKSQCCDLVATHGKVTDGAGEVVLQYFITPFLCPVDGSALLCPAVPFGKAVGVENGDIT